MVKITELFEVVKVEGKGFIKVTDEVKRPKWIIRQFVYVNDVEKATHFKAVKVQIERGNNEHILKRFDGRLDNVKFEVIVIEKENEALHL